MGSCLDCRLTCILKILSSSIVSLLFSVILPSILKLIKLLVVLNYLYLVHFVYIKLFAFVICHLDHLERSLKGFSLSRVNCGSVDWIKKITAPRSQVYLHYRNSTSSAVSYISNLNFNTLRKNFYEFLRKGEEMFQSTSSSGQSLEPSEQEVVIIVEEKCEPPEREESKLRRRRPCIKCGKQYVSRSKKTRSMDAERCS